MKKIIMMAVALLMSVASFAQNGVGSFTFQPKVGLNIANISNSDADPRFGVAVGAEIEYQVTDMISLAAAALYSQQGDTDDAFTQKLDYINVPIVANVYIIKGLAMKLGIQPGFKVNDQIGNMPLSDNFNNPYKAKSFDLTFPIGLSYQYGIIVLDARYNFGVTQLYDVGDSRNSTFQITLGYKF